MADFWVLVSNSANTVRYCELHNVPMWMSTNMLDMAGTFTFQVPAADPNTAQLSSKRIVTCYTSINGAQVTVGSGIIDQIMMNLDAEGNPTGMLMVTGSSRMRELVYRHVGPLLVSDGMGGTTDTGPQDIIAFAPSGWALDVVDGSNVTTKAIYHQYQDETVLTAFSKLAEITGEHFRLGADQSIVWLNFDLWDAANASGVRAFYNADPIAIENNDVGVVISRISKMSDSYDYFIGRAYAFGVGDGASRITLDGSTNPGAWSADWVQGSDSKGFYLQHIPTWSTYGIESVIQWKDEADAQTLLETTYEYMRRSQNPVEQYTIDLVGLKTTLQPGTTIRVIAHEYVDTYHTINIDADLVIMTVNNRIDDEGLRTVSLTCSTIDKYTATEYSVMADQLAQADNYYTHTQPSGSLPGLATSITPGKTLTLAAADNYTLTVPGTGTVLLDGTAATTYLKLDGSNDPMTGNLDLSSASLNISGASVPIEIYRDAGVPTERISAYLASTTNGGRIALRGAGGTNASPSDVLNNYVLGEVQFHGYVNGAHRQFGVIRTSAVNTISSTSYPTNMYFIVTLQGTTTNTVLMTLHNSGYVGINSTTATPRGMLGVIARAATDVVSSFKGASSHTADLMRWEDASNNTLSLVNANGGLVINEIGGASAALRAETDTEPNMLVTDPANDLMYMGGTTNGIRIDKGGALTLIGTAVYERHVQLVPNIYGNASTTPNTDAIGTAGAAIFPTTGSYSTYLQFEIPNDWNGADMYIEADMVAVSAISGTDTIKLDLSYRSIAEGESITNGTVATSSITDSTDYTTNQTKHQRFTLTYNHADQPLTVQDHVYAAFTRDTSVANDAAASIGITAFELIYTSKGIPDSN